MGSRTRMERREGLHQKWVREDLARAVLWGRQVMENR